MQNKVWWSTGITLLFGLLLAGCGPLLGSSRVSQQLQSASQNINSYQSTAVLSVHEAGSVQQYFVETWFQAPDRYRIALGNDHKEISQIILHNDKGTYLISPSAKKAIRFQGSWAEQQGQFYLYQTLIKDILANPPIHYQKQNQTINFTFKPSSVLSSYFTEEQVQLDRKTLLPQNIVMKNASKNPVMTIHYETFKKGVSFKKDAFSPEQTTTFKSLELPVSTSVQGFGVVEPAWIPARDTLQDESESKGVVFIRYSGAIPFTIVENRPQQGTADLGSGQLITLNGIPAVWIGNGSVHQLYWMNQNVEYMMTSKMNQSDFLRVASSTVDSSGK